MSVDKKQLQHAGIEQEFHMIIFNFSGESVYDGMVYIIFIILRLEQNFTAELHSLK